MKVLFVFIAFDEKKDIAAIYLKWMFENFTKCSASLRFIQKWFWATQTVTQQIETT